MRTICSQNVNLSETLGQRNFNFCIIILQLIYKTSIADSIDKELKIIIMSLQSQIQKIIEDRKKRVEKIQFEIDNINKLMSNLEYVKKRIQDLSIDNSTEYVQKIQTKITELANANIQALHLRERFERDTINIGVAGFTHAGKSTFLQTVSGLDDFSIPKADDNDKNSGKPTTATRSQIYNSSNRYADVFFRSEADFLEYVNNYVDSLGLPKADSLASFKTINFDSVDVESLRGDRDLIKIDIDRIKGIQEAVPYFENNLRNVTTIKVNGDKFSDLKQYVAYSYDDSSKRMYPAVKEVKIYSPFNGVDSDLKVGLIDLPGFGEHENVTKKTLDDIKNDVDAVIILYRPGLANYELLEDEKRKFRDVLNSQPAISNKADFISFLINKDTRVPDNYIEKAKDNINDIWPDLKVQVASSNNQNQVENVMSSIVNGLASSLAKMDDDLISAYMKDRDLTETLGILTEVSLCLERLTTRNSATKDITEKAKIFRKQLNKELTRLLIKYRSDEDIDKKFENELETIKEEIDTEIENKLLYEPIEIYNTWEDYIENATVGDITGKVPLELKRLWISIIKRYIKLDAIYKESMDNLKKDILKIFVGLTGDLIEDKNADNFNEILGKLKNRPENQIYQAFLSINNLKQDFRQNIYPFIFKIGDNRILQQKGISQEDGTNEGVFDLNKEGLSISYLKEQLICQAKFANDQIKSTILEHYILRYFLIGVLDTFVNYIIYTNVENDYDFVDFCDNHKGKIYPDKYGDKADIYKYDELKTCINGVINLVKSF